MKAAEAATEKFTCLYRSADGQACSQTAILSHAVPRRGALRSIDDGSFHVVQLGTTLKRIGQGDWFGDGRISSKQASTFRGFCQKHDKLLFSEVEDTAPELNLRTALLFSIRSEALENFRKRQANALRLELLKEFKASAGAEATDILREIHRHGYVIQLSLARLSDLFAMHHSHVSRPEFYYCLVKFQGPINFACSATIDPVHTHAGVDIRGSDFHGVEHNQIWGFAGNIGAQGYFSLATLEALPGHRTPLFLRDFQAGRRHFSDRILSLFALHSEDLMVQASWYDRLPAEKRTLLKSFRENWIEVGPVEANQYHLTIGHPPVPIQSIQRSPNFP